DLGARGLKERLPGPMVSANSFSFSKADNAIAPIPRPLSLKKWRRVIDRSLSRFSEECINAPFTLLQGFQSSIGSPQSPILSSVLGQCLIHVQQDVRHHGPGRKF